MRVDFHVHSFFSDGKHDPETLVKYARKLDIHIALTDHDTSRGISRVEGEVIPGQEVTTQFGHVVILCNFPPNPPKDLSLLVDYSRENSCVLFPSHPFDIFRKGIGEQVYRFKFNAIEIYNSKAPRRANMKAEIASRSLSLPGLANSDAHVKESMGSAYNEVDCEEFNVDEILEKLRRGEISPVPVGLTVTAKLKIAQWYIERKLRLEKDTRGTLREVQGN
ncbi:PHP-associated domain-containing protein [Metallosphaera javensis (ex Sakai et al. 2022)]|uniref:PHP-associated domain-containing protein n=1 Tax=Metallosphaera javensis (ex Sakai et al. 2022) TaxID=2775498 RepID=UPI00258A46B7|nr:MAG: phosphoesterase [Metallosphaera javensis (ex Sakai et al. 2022)]